jgi:hypothetical protein
VGSLWGSAGGSPGRSPRGSIGGSLEGDPGVGTLEGVPAGSHGEANLGGP